MRFFEQKKRLNHIDLSVLREDLNPLKRNGRDRISTYISLTFSYLKSKITLVTRIGTLLLFYYSCDFWKERLLSKFNKKI
jgi:hypothetical protein